MNGIAMEAVRRLPAGSLHANLLAVNIAQPDALRRAIEETLSAVGGSSRNRHVTLVVPDAAVRVLLLDFDTLPTNDSEAAAILRFRLRKTLPFDVDHSAISFDRLSTNGVVRTVVAVSPRNVVQEYEQLLADIGYQSGVVMPSVLATLGIFDPDRPALLVKIDHETTSMVLADSTGIRLLRTLEHPGGVYSNDELLRGVHGSLIYYEDNFNQTVGRVVLAGGNTAPEIASMLAQEHSVQVEMLSAGKSPADAPFLAAVEGALLA